MSDDEYYDDEYADFHDMLYDADPDPDLADDLAERAAYSPVWFDNPNEETRDYFSDWEYYSDDYFDDDPVLLSESSKSQTESTSISRPKHQHVKRGRKRKLSEARERVPLDAIEMGALKACIKGTVWKSASPEPAESFQRGLTRRVALRLSKAIMKSAYDTKQGFGTGSLARDESWANDLSLADMGLRTEMSMDLQNGADVVGGDEDDEGDEGHYEREDAYESAGENGTEIHDNGETKEAFALQQPDRLGSRAKRGIEDSRGQESDEERHVSKKKRRMIASETSTESKNTHNTPDTSLNSDISEAAMDTGLEPPAELPQRGRGRSKKQSTKAQKATNRLESTEKPVTSTRKRKMSDVESSATTSTASSRAKRVAPSNEAKGQTITEDSGTTAARQKTRNLRSSSSRKGPSNGVKK